MTTPQPAQSHRDHIRAILVLGLPLIGSQLAQFAIQITDTIMLGWYDVTDLAAVTLAGGFYFLCFILGAGFAWAVMPVVAEAVESGDTVQVRRVTRMGLWLSFAYGLLMMLPLFFAERIFLAIGQEPVIAEKGGIYLAIAGWQLIPALSLLVLRSFLSALERTAIILWVTLGSAALNVAVNWLLIFGNLGFPELGIRGAAIASVSVNMAGVIGLALYVARVTPDYDLFARLWRIDGDAARRIFLLGVPIGLTSLAEGGLFTASSVMMGWLGEVPLAAHGIALTITSAVFMVHVGLSQAATVRAGRAFGRRDEGALRRGGIWALALSAAVAALTVAVFLALPGPLVGLFVGLDDPDRAAILATGAVLLAMAALFQTVDAAQVVVLGLLRGVQDTRVPMWMAGISYWLCGMPAAYVLGFVLGWGGVGIWTGLVIGLGVAAVLLSWRFWGGSVRISLPVPGAVRGGAPPGPV